MGAFGKDSEEVVHFMLFFKQLKLFIDDCPEYLSEMYNSDSSVATVCDNLTEAVLKLSNAEQSNPYLFTAPVDPVFIKEWRDYESRYKNILDQGCYIFEKNSLVFRMREAGIINDKSISQDLKFEEEISESKFDVKWKNEDEIASKKDEDLSNIFWTINFNTQVCPMCSENQEDDRIDEGIRVWSELTDNIGLNVREVLRRRHLIPFILFPRNFSAPQKSKSEQSLYMNLHEAQSSFIFGSNAAAIALMRSIIEVILKDYYQAEGRDLSEKINNVRQRLPKAASAEALHRLRMTANSILHIDKENNENFSRIDDIALEKNMVSLFFHLRALIEETP
jgi:hypothetical protein